jgi:hypothetical protein
LYTGRMVDPTGALPRVDTRENEGRAATRAKNLAQTALEVTEQPAACDELYFPATHGMHWSPSGPVEPALQVQLVKAALPAGELDFDGQPVHVELAAAFTAVEYVPVPQFVHASAPVDVLYLPAAQSVHGPPFGPVDPALQVQLVKAALPASELESDGQAVHSVSGGRVTPFENLAAEKDDQSAL